MATEFQTLLLDALPKLRGYALLLTRNHAAANDLLQETALKAWKAQLQFAMGTNFKAWLYRIMRNENINTYRYAKRLPVPIEDISQEFLGREGDQESNVVAAQLLRAVERLPPERREPLLLRCVSGLSYEEMAEVLECSIGTVKSRLWRARNTLQKEFDEENSAPRPLVAAATTKRKAAARPTPPDEAGLVVQRA